MISFDILKVLTTIPQIIPFIPVTLVVLVASALFGSLIGGILTSWRLKPKTIRKKIGDSYVFIVRCTPPIILLFIVYYGLPKLLLDVFNVDINTMHKLLFVIISFSLLFGATTSEVFRSAYRAVDHGQREAALAIGLSPWQSFYRIILPQATVVALPNYCNSFIALLKDGTLAYTIGLVDIMGEANLIIGRNYGNYALETYLSVAIVYLVLIIIFEKGFAYVENHLSLSKLSLSNTKGGKGKSWIGTIFTTRFG